MSKEPKLQRRFRFSLRAMFLIVTIICVWLGWELRLVRERREVLSELRAASGGSSDFYYWSLEAAEVDFEHSFLCKADWYENIRVSSIRRLLGDETCLMINMPASTDAKLVERVERAFPEGELSIDAKNATRPSWYWSKRNTGTIFKTGLPASQSPRP